MSEFPRLPFPFRACLSLLLGGLALSACAHSPVPSGTTMAKEASTMNTTPSEAFRPRDLAEYPEITPEEIGRRFLKLVDGLGSFRELTLQRVEEAIQVPMAYVPAGKAYSFTIRLPDSGWYYGIDYNEALPDSPESKAAMLQFVNKRDERADMAPVCGMDLAAYEHELEKMGFSKKPPQVDEIGRLLALFYSRGDLVVQVRERREADLPESKLRHSCVEYIDVGRG